MFTFIPLFPSGLFSVSLPKKINFFRLLSIGLQAGLGLREALFSLRVSEKNKYMLFIIDDIIARITAGDNLAVALSRHPRVFSVEEVALLQASEAMGTMPTMLWDIAEENYHRYKLRQGIMKLLVYPAFLIFFSIIAIVILLTYVMPGIVSLFPPEVPIPFITRVFLSVSLFFQTIGWILICVCFLAALLLYLLYFYLLPVRIFFDNIILHIPGFSQVLKMFYAYRFSKLLSQFYTAGVNIPIGFSLMKDMFSNFFYQKKILEIKHDLQSGFSLAEAMDGSSLFDHLLVQVISVGEKTGNMAEVLSTMALYYRDMVHAKILLIMSFLEPTLLIIIAILIGSIIASLFLPLVELIHVLQ